MSFTPPPTPPTILTGILYEADGEITARVTGTEADIAASAAAMGKSYVLADDRTDPDTQHVVDGVIVDKPAGSPTSSERVWLKADPAAKRWREMPNEARQLELIWQALADLDSNRPFGMGVRMMIDQIAALKKKYPD